MFMYHRSTLMTRQKATLASKRTHSWFAPPTSVSIYSVCWCSSFFQSFFYTKRSRACSLTNRSRCWRGRTDRWRRPGEGWSWRPGHTTYPAGSYKKKQKVTYQKIRCFYITVDSTTTALRKGDCTYRRISKQIHYKTCSALWCRFCSSIKNTSIWIF